MARAWAATTRSTSSPSASTFPSRICSSLPTSSPAAFRSFTRGTERKVFRLNGHRYGVFICYESVFADEVRQFAQLGAEVLVNISDDGWYGDTSAPWQHLNMARMRAIENRRWILRDTNTGVTAVIDPYGRVRQSIPRHQTDALPARIRLPQRLDVLHRARRCFCVGVCSAEFGDGGLGGGKAPARQAA